MFRGIKLAAIGPVTAQTLIRHGLSPAVVAHPYTIDSLVQAIVQQDASDHAKA
jgi:uroporphyrinogen-III synthase